eukprot:6177420-Pleurochrysis_carterae.AAC.2
MGRGKDGDKKLGRIFRSGAVLRNPSTTPHIINTETQIYPWSTFAWSAPEGEDLVNEAPQRHVGREEDDVGGGYSADAPCMPAQQTL